MLTVVTGAAGFIGSAVTRQLLHGGRRRLRCVVEPGGNRANLVGLDVEIVEADVTDRAAMAAVMRGATRLFHLAAIYALWTPRPHRLYRVNVHGTRVVLDAARRAGVERVVHTSSIAAVGRPRPGEQLADESCRFDLWDDADAYVRSKFLSEQIARAFAADGLPVTMVSPAFPFGERDLGPTPTGRLVVELLAGRLPVYVDGGFNAVDVEDVAAAHLLAEERGRVGEKYIAGGHNVTYREFNRLVADVAGLRAPAARLPRRAFHGLGWLAEKVADHVTHTAPPLTYRSARWATRRAWYDCSRARDELGMPITPLRDTVERAVGWFQQAR